MVSGPYVGDVGLYARELYGFWVNIRPYALGSIANKVLYKVETYVEGRKPYVVGHVNKMYG